MRRRRVFLDSGAGLGPPRFVDVPVADYAGMARGIMTLDAGARASLRLYCRCG